MNDIFLTVIIPVYNVEEPYLRQCLNSLCKQIFEEVEFIVVDDGSDKCCGKMCDEYLSKDKRFKVIHTDNSGVSNARNVGISKARGKYILFLDGDDYFEKDTCKICYEKMEEHQLDIMYFKFVHNDDFVNSSSLDVHMCSEYEYIEMKKCILSHNEPLEGYPMGSPWGKVFKRSIISENKLEFVNGLKKCQDRVFMFDYAQYVNCVGLCDYFGYHYVDNPESVTRKYNENIIDILGQVIDQIKIRLENSNILREEFSGPLATMCLSFIFTILKLDILNSNNKQTIKEKRKRIIKLISISDYKNALRKGNLKSFGKRKSLIGMLLKMKCYLLACLIGEKIL